ncbi:MAG: heme lyase CcmF/NrfE family subunit [Acidimicrobiia bacterium]|nr:heme lyase CcmF/NrfE family subunit [Acidimicrobiia bacterium]
MNLALGSGAITLAFAASVLGAVTLAGGLLRGRRELLPLGRVYAWIALGGAALAFIAMERALITRDFSVAYVAEVGSSRTPPLFNFTALWSSLEGSILLWTLVLAGYLVVVATKFRRRLTDPMVAWALLTMFVVAIFFFGLMLRPILGFEGPANPFASFDPPPGYDGPGPNPLLQNNVLVAFHPPLLYLGYVGFTVPFAFAIAALATGRLGEGWLIETRRWTLFAWGFLTFGIVLGAWWSYDVLGWGGYWAWDPVENASILPWLTGTAYLHSVMVQERRGMLRVWNLSLVCATFSLTILGTFITRSGVLDSVHAFSESGIGPTLLGFFALIVIVTVGLIGWRGDLLRSPGRVDSPISREGAFLANNLMFGAFAFVVLLGTVFPLILEAVNGEQISIGLPYFNRMATPIGLTLLFLMAIAPALPWRKTTGEVLQHRLEWPAWIGVASLVVALLSGARGLAPLLAFGLGGFAAGAALRTVVLATRRQGWRGLVGRTNGGMIVHLGVVLVAVALAASNSYLSQAEFELFQGESATISGHTLTYERFDEIDSVEKLRSQVTVSVDGQTLVPSLDRFKVSGRVIGDPDTRSTLVEDVQLAIISLPTDDGPVIVRATVQPMIMWLWLGGIVMGIGTVLSIFPGRRRRGTEAVSAPVGQARPLRPSTPAPRAEEPVSVR